MHSRQIIRENQKEKSEYGVTNREHLISTRHFLYNLFFQLQSKPYFPESVFEVGLISER